MLTPFTPIMEGDATMEKPGLALSMVRSADAPTKRPPELVKSPVVFVCTPGVELVTSTEISQVAPAEKRSWIKLTLFPPAAAVTCPEQLPDKFNGECNVTASGRVLVNSTFATGLALAALSITYVSLETLPGAIVDGENDVDKVGVPA